MKYVYEFMRPHPSVGLTIHPYTAGGREAPAWRGARVEILLIDSQQPDPDKNPPREYEEGDAIYLETTTDVLRDIIKQLQSQLDVMERHAQAEVAEQRARALQCLVCKTWYDPRNGNEHGDGRGMTCMSDGTVYLHSRRIRIVDPDYEHYGDKLWTKNLAVGNRFVIVEPIGEYEKREFVALANAEPHLGSYRVRVKREP